jgi:hypothetical protein
MNGLYIKSDMEMELHKDLTSLAKRVGKHRNTVRRWLVSGFYEDDEFIITTRVDVVKSGRGRAR